MIDEIKHFLLVIGDGGHLQSFIYILCDRIDKAVECGFSFDSALAIISFRGRFVLRIGIVIACLHWLTMLLGGVANSRSHLAGMSSGLDLLFAFLFEG